MLSRPMQMSAAGDASITVARRCDMRCRRWNASVSPLVSSDRSGSFMCDFIVPWTHVFLICVSQGSEFASTLATVPDTSRWSYLSTRSCNLLPPPLIHYVFLSSHSLLLKTFYFQFIVRAPRGHIFSVSKMNDIVLEGRVPIMFLSSSHASSPPSH